MNLTELLRDNPALVGQIASQLGVEKQDAQRGIETLIPSVSRAMRNNAAQPGGLEALASALSNGQHARYLDDLSTLARPESLADGNAILGHILGSKDASRNVAGHAANSSGLNSGMLRQMLPILASLAMGALAKQQQSSAGPFEGTPPGRTGNPQLGGLESFLDMDGDGSVIDDVLNLAKKFL